MATRNRMATIIMSKINKLLGKIEDPTEELEYSYEKQKDLLEKVKRGLADVATAKNSLKIQKVKLEQDIPKLDRQAKACMEQGKEPLAKAALERKTSTQEQIKSLTDQISKLDIEENKLIEASKVLEIKLEQLKSTKETIKAQYTAAKASVQINESLSGLGGKVGNVGQSIEKAKDKTEQMNARSSAISDLTNAGVLNNSIGEKEDSIDKELSKIESKNAVDSEFRKMKRQSLLKKNDLNFFKT